MSIELRPMTPDDLEPAGEVQLAAFDKEHRQRGVPVEAHTDIHLQRVRRRLAHFVTHDPDGSWVAVSDDRVIGVGLALRRDDLWGLSLLVVDPAEQSAGTGRRLLDATLQYAAGANRAVILSSQDPRAIRAYATSGFALHPQLAAKGEVRQDVLPASTRKIGAVDEIDPDWYDELGRTVRGAGYGPDLDPLLFDAQAFVVDDVDGRGCALVRSGGVVLQLLATDDDTAEALLWRALAHVHELGRPTSVNYLNSRQQWAFQVLLRARLPLQPEGPVLWLGSEPPTSYKPSGAFF